MPFLSYAQNFEDVLLWRALKDVGAGFYVDVGAADPDQDSVTRAFYDRGWHGINVEPAPDFAARLAAARPRDVNLALAVGDDHAGADLFYIPATGLSTTRADLAREMASRGYRPSTVAVPTRTLDSILSEHAEDTIHFLKVDVEGAEGMVLASCNLDLFRPWIILVEATHPLSTKPSHEAWEALLTGRRYRHAYFDGLNRFYVAEERWQRLAPAFGTPVNVFDDVRRADLAAAPADDGREAKAVEARAVVAEASARSAYARAFELARDLAQAQGSSAVRLTEAEALRQQLHAAHQQLHATLHRASAAEMDAAEARHLLRSMRASTSWVVTKPLRVLKRAGDRLRRAGPPSGDAPAAPAPARPVARAEEGEARDDPAPPPASGQGAPAGGEESGHPSVRPIRAVHQFHSGSATGDAITASMLLLRDLLRGMGFRSDIFVEHLAQELAENLRPMAELPRHADHVLILRHSMGHDALGGILALPAPKILLYHNITPPEFLGGNATLQAYARLGRRQLAEIRPRVVAALADSEYNAQELRGLGYAPVRACNLLFDLDALEARAAGRPRPAGYQPFTVLFTGRVAESKAQAEVVEAYARFRRTMERPCRLVLVGRLDGAGPYLSGIDAAMRRHGLEAELVVTGPVSDEELHARFAEADLYLSLSHHEGFGVPLVEAAAHSVPVLAWPSGAVPYTLGGNGLLDSRDPDRVAARMRALAEDPGARAALVAAQRAAIRRFALDAQLPILREALAMAGAPLPPGPETREALRANLRFTVTGHAAGSYSLAAVNRALALAIEAQRPGCVRLRPVEGEPTDDVSGIPEVERDGVQPLVARGAAETGPEVVISQHYPVHPPEAPGDLPLALFFWEESLVPAATIRQLAGAFRAVLAPTEFVARALVSSGLPIPVRVIGHAPRLAPMQALARDRAGGREPAPGRIVTFLHVSSCFPRKGVDVLLAAYARAFRRGDPVRLVIKGFPNPHNTVPDDVARRLAADPDAPAIEVIDRDLPEEALLDLYREADAMVLPTRGEGLNLPAAEAMAAGIPLIVTGAGGHMDFVDARTARLLRWRHAPSRSHLATPGSLAAEPDEDDLVAALREVAAAFRGPEGRAALAEQARRARLRVARLGPGPVMERLETMALDLLLAPPPAPIRVAWVTSWAVRCGIAEYARQMLRAMPAHAGIADHVILPDDRWPAGAEAPASPHRVRAAWRLGDPGTPARLAGAIMAEDPHAIVLQHQPGLIAWTDLARLIRDPALDGRAVVVTLHNTRHLTEQPEAEREAARGALAGADQVLVHTVADLENLAGIGLLRNVTLLPHGVKAPLPAPPRRGDAGPVIGCYGFLLPGKGVGELIEALALLRATWPGARLRLVNALYGTRDSARELLRCRRIVRARGLADAVEWHAGFLPEEESLLLLSGCDVVVLPTQASKESSSASMRDAVASGAPVLVTPLPFFDDAGEAVIRARGVAPDDLAAALDALLRDPARQEGTRAAARRWLAERSWDVVAERVQGMLLGLAATRRIGSLRSVPQGVTPT